MVDERFKMSYKEIYKQMSYEPVKGVMYFDGERVLGSDEVVKLLNSLHKENETLKKINEYLKKNQ